MSYTPRKGDIVWLDFTPQSGREQRGRRPAMVVSNDFFNSRTGLSLVCPITSSKRDNPLHTRINNIGKITGYIMVEQLRAVDFSSRNAEFIEKAPEELLKEILAKLDACL
jgi:mRNA interferase MazF